MPQRSATLTLVFTLSFSLPFVLEAADGDLDSSFSSDGKDVQDWGADHAHALAVAATKDGSVLVGGQVRFADFDFGVVRYLPDGSLDTGFGDDGLARIGFDVGGTQSDSLHAILPLPDGKTLLAGSVATATVYLPGIARLTAAGELDPDFGVGGKIVLDLLPDTSTRVSVSSAVRQADGRIVLLGTATPASGPVQAHVFLLRLDEDGVPDLSFSSDGWTLLDLPNASFESGDALAIDDAGRIHVGANALAPDDFRPVYLRVGTTGLVEVLEVVDLGEVWIVADLAVEPVGGKILLSLRDNDADLDAGVVVRLDSAGDLDAGFGTGGIADLTLEEGSWMSAMALQSDRKIALAGHHRSHRQPAGRLSPRTPVAGRFPRRELRRQRRRALRVRPRSGRSRRSFRPGSGRRPARRRRLRRHRHRKRPSLRRAADAEHAHLHRRLRARLDGGLAGKLRPWRSLQAPGAAARSS